MGVAIAVALWLVVVAAIIAWEVVFPAVGMAYLFGWLN